MDGSRWVLIEGDLVAGTQAVIHDSACPPAGDLRRVSISDTKSECSYLTRAD